MGCPCENYSCDIPEKKAILTLYTYNRSPVLIQPNGNRLTSDPYKSSVLGDKTEIEFKINEDTEVFHSCSSMLNDELFVLGGHSTSNNIQKQVVLRCHIKAISKFLEISRQPIIRYQKLLAVNLNESVIYLMIFTKARAEHITIHGTRRNE